MARRRRLPFLPRSDYRLRRLHDAARLLPLFGFFLVILPILWSPVEDDQRRTATDGLYLFVVWTGLIAVAAIFARKLAGGQDAVPPGPVDPDASEGDRDAL
jgi:hypothetical protein